MGLLGKVTPLQAKRERELKKKLIDTFLLIFIVVVLLLFTLMVYLLYLRIESVLGHVME